MDTISYLVKKSSKATIIKLNKEKTNKNQNNKIIKIKVKLSKEKVISLKMDEFKH
jgi:hypothetical protein